MELLPREDYFYIGSKKFLDLLWFGEAGVNGFVLCSLLF